MWTSGMGSVTDSAMTSFSTTVALAASSSSGEPDVHPTQLMIASGLLSASSDTKSSAEARTKSIGCHLSLANARTRDGCLLTATRVDESPDISMASRTWLPRNPLAPRRRYVVTEDSEAAADRERRIHGSPGRSRRVVRCL